MSKQFVEIDAEVFARLEAIAREKGYETVEKLLTAVSLEFSRGCSVTPPKKTATPDSALI